MSCSAASLERSYLTYSHRQRQKSLIIVNAVDLVLKFVLAAVYIIQLEHNVRLNLEIEEIFALKNFVTTPTGHSNRRNHVVSELRSCQSGNLSLRFVEMFCQQLSPLGRDMHVAATQSPRFAIPHDIVKDPS
jgi:hypothetical protein